MCGIAGIISFDSQIQKDSLGLMLSQIQHRGPDQKGMYIDRHIAMGIRRLSIIDLSTGNQPIENEDGSVTVVFNGEIYNYQDLSEQLKKKGHKFKTKSDTEVLVHLYEEYGSKMSKYLNGMFAFAIWDKVKQSLFLSRDPAGIKPLYFYQIGKTLIFASEIKSLLSNPKVKKDVDPNALKLYSFLGYIPGKLSIFKNIRKLLPGHSLIYSKNGKNITNFFTIESNKFSSAGDIDYILEKAVTSQAVADVPLGVLLSGGIDSSLVAYYLTKGSSKRINSFSIAFAEKSFDESYYARVVSSFLHTKHHEEVFKSEDVINLFPKILQKMDEPFADPSLFPTYKLCQLTKKYVKVALSGDGGDELFGGYPTYQGHLLAGKLKRLLPRNIAGVAIKLINSFGVSFENYPKSETLKRFLQGLHKNDLERHFEWMSLGGSSKLLGMNSNLLRLLGGEISKITTDIPTKFQLLDFYTYLMDDLLVKVDRASMFNSLEVRVPLLDLTVLDYAFKVGNKHVSLLETKKVLRSLAREKLPEEIANRKKKGFGIPLSKWLFDGLSDFCLDFLQNKKLYDFFDQETVLDLWENHQSGRENNAKTIWMLVMFSGWLNKWYK
ncbi:asparagine synthase (glutamine-hydrolyzing) [Candidatus Daviesbacteria bacterium RIFCSPLOWO2_01_FULL_39_12]|uniref:asparagine synthase (glutamine-hydrolyzing) n=1 Tax=Candidatus Daviesbacteria bacterium RIFCSPLOWO2_01_FULL_39_12 TaxID=1797785 RepID=A0A1F5KNZ5_9BACT|nr:MAG: asparagine synthase (glutamine-hydrolyzing) [Candidatus Daviesbacteria bacterium RIFCSPHIGHO2_02_FULL_39_8]OGE42638.1 MAG: asparagine synthase (glutamine-hydrolyzing) [Candidatus Daviesbacteria bacterium RIFCSPLOWO2_01_FULL_39_12]